MKLIYLDGSVEERILKSDKLLWLLLPHSQVFNIIVWIVVIDTYILFFPQHFDDHFVVITSIDVVSYVSRLLYFLALRNQFMDVSLYLSTTQSQGLFFMHGLTFSSLWFKNTPIRIN